MLKKSLAAMDMFPLPLERSEPHPCHAQSCQTAQKAIPAAAALFRLQRRFW
jgi:hypothetical protein